MRFCRCRIATALVPAQVMAQVMAQGMSRVTILVLAISLLLAGALTSPLAWSADSRQALPAWSVLVLRLVSATHVEPTTGIVVARSGMVLVPIDFARPGEEIVVLDGGKNIVRNGRPARTVQRFPEAGVAVIEVEGLSRNPPSFRAADLMPDDAVVLAAFPPAELIAEGAQPVFAATKITVSAENGLAGLAADQPLPNLTGPVLDTCGNLVAYSRANGVQSLDTDQQPQYLWMDELRRNLASININLEAGDCSANGPPTAAPTEPEPKPEQEQEQAPETPLATDDEPEMPQAEDILQEVPAEALDDTAVATGDEAGAGEEILQNQSEEFSEEWVAEGAEDAEEPVTDLAAGASDTGVETGSATAHEEAASGLSMWLVIAAIFAAAALGWIALHYLRNRPKQSPAPEATGQMAAAESDSQKTQPDPEAAQALAARVHSPGPDGGQIQLSGSMGNGSPLHIRHRVTGDSIKLVIGGKDSDIEIDDPTISQSHAVLHVEAGRTTLTDLGSGSGSRVKGVPCYEGEIMHVEPGDEIVLGDVQFTFVVDHQPENPPQDEDDS